MKNANILYISMKTFTIAGASKGFRGEMNGSFQVTENLMSDSPFFLHVIIHLCLGLFFWEKEKNNMDSGIWFFNKINDESFLSRK